MVGAAPVDEQGRDDVVVAFKGRSEPAGRGADWLPARAAVPVVVASRVGRAVVVGVEIQVGVQFAARASVVSRTYVGHRGREGLGVVGLVAQAVIIGVIVLHWRQADGVRCPRVPVDRTVTGITVTLEPT